MAILALTGTLGLTRNLVRFSHSSKLRLVIVTSFAMPYCPLCPSRKQMFRPSTCRTTHRIDFSSRLGRVVVHIMRSLGHLLWRHPQWDLNCELEDTCRIDYEECICLHLTEPLIKRPQFRGSSCGFLSIAWSRSLCLRQTVPSLLRIVQLVMR